MSSTVLSTPSFMADRTCTASLPERRKTPSHRSWTVYVSSSFIPTMLDPAPMPARSESTTLCSVVFGKLGSSVSANSIFRVLAGGSRQCALWAARTSPDSASETIQERALMSFGSTGAPVPRFTCVPALPSRSPPTVDMFAGGVAEGDGDGPASASANAGAVRERDSRVAEVTSKGRRAVLLLADGVELVAGTVEKLHGSGREVPFPSLPRRRSPVGDGDTEPMKLTRPVSWFLVVFGVWSWVIW